MAGTFINYFDGFLRVEFRHGSLDGLYMTLTAHGDAVSTTHCEDNFTKGKPEIMVGDDVRIETGMCATFCPFPALIAWLEAITTEVQECAFQWDDEGPEGELRWRNSWEHGKLYISWDGCDPPVKHSVRLNRVQTVRAFYEAFREFVESDRYDPLRYEELNVGECCSLLLESGDLNVLADSLAARDRFAAYGLLMVILDHACDDKDKTNRRAALDFFVEQAEKRDARESDVENIDRWFPVAWDGLSELQRRQDVVDNVFPGGACLASGAKLRDLRATRIEQWLAANTMNNRVEKEAR